MQVSVGTVLLCVGISVATRAQGHGPVYALSTPTLGRGAWSVDIASMARLTSGGQTLMVRPMVSYGLTEDLQLSVSWPVRLATPEGTSPAPARGLTRMPGTQDVEATVGWRFHRRATGVGRRLESTAFVSIDVPLDDIRAGVEPSPRVIGAVASGYASRVVYIWLGGLYGRSLSNAINYRFGDTVMYSFVFGYRPSVFRHDYPAPDWRIFVEAVGEWSGHDRAQGAMVVNSGGDRVTLAPTLLGLYGHWGVAGGPAFPVVQRLNGIQVRDRMRWVLNIIFWF